MKTTLLENKTFEEVLNWFEEHNYSVDDVKKEYEEESGTMFYVNAEGFQDADAFEIEEIGENFNLYSC